MRGNGVLSERFVFPEFNVGTGAKGVSSVPASLIYRVNDLELDTLRGCLSRNGEEIHLKPKAFQILVYLLAHRDRLVSKEELLDQFWKDTAVSDDILAQAVAEARR